MDLNDEPAWLEGIVGDDPRHLIASENRLIRVVAGPGAGKTTCLKRRTRRLVEGDGVPTERIFVGTFTRAIANDLRRELGDEITVSTIHSLAYQMLRDNPAACQGMSLRFLLQYEEASMLYDIAPSVPQHNDQDKRTSELRRLQSARSERIDYADAAFAGAIRGWLQRHGGMLIGEVVYLAVVALESYDIPPGAFDHVVVDEYQDLTAAEQELVERIWSNEGSLVVMGDNDQSIYSFRFNHPQGIDEFKTRWGTYEPDDLHFPENRRCGEAILIVANQMMAEAGSQKEPMQAASGRNGQVTQVHWPTADDEVDGLSAYIKARPEESFLVLVTRRFIGHRLREAIGDGAVTAFTEEVLEHPIAQERFALASALADPKDSVAIRAWLAFHGTQHVQATARNAVAYASLPTTSTGLELVRAIADGSVVPSGAGVNSVVLRSRAMVDAVESTGTLSISEQIDFLFDPDEAAHEDQEERRSRVRANLQTLRAASHEIAAGLHEPSLQQVMSALRYRIATRAALISEIEEEGPRVRIMTLHSAKGLEADNVVLAGIADQIMPGPTTELDKIAEQRRLLYVAVTRAKENLIISWPRRVRYEDAMQNAVRVDDVVTVSGVRYAVGSRSSLLPQGLGGALPGDQWLSDQL